MSMTSEPQKPIAEIRFADGSEIKALIQQQDWSNTPLGAIETWSQPLRTIVSTMLAAGFPQCLFWGQDYIQLYNDAFADILAAKHPIALGQPARETQSNWQTVKPLLDLVMTMGEAVWAETQLYPRCRCGYLEESYFTLCYSPVRDQTGQISGVLATAIEMTGQVIGQRRLTMLQALATARTGAKNPQAACLATAAALSADDIPFALFYQVNPQGTAATLIAASGFSAASTAAPATIDLSASSQSWPLAAVRQTGEPQLVTDAIDRFGALPGGAWPESSHSALILPILTGREDSVEWLLVAGISPRLQFDAQYRAFLELVAQQLEISIAALTRLDRPPADFSRLQSIHHFQDEFLLTVTHELQAPLATILGWARLLRTKSFDAATIDRALEAIDRNATIEAKLVKDLLDVSSILTGKLRLKSQLVELMPLIQNVVATVRQAAEAKQIHLTETIAHNAPITISADGDRLRQLITILLENAIKFTPAGEQINLRLDRLDSQIQITVTDTGIGITPDFLPLVFDRFTQAEVPSSHSPGGVGIGLAIARHLVELHHGTIEVASVGGQGTAFTVKLPIARGHSEFVS